MPSPRAASAAAKVELRSHRLAGAACTLRRFPAHRAAPIPCRVSSAIRHAEARAFLSRRTGYHAGVCKRGQTRRVSRRTFSASARKTREQDAMTRAELARMIDHSVLRPEASEADIRAGADVVRAWRIGFYCVQPCWLKMAAEMLAGT